MEFTKRLAEDKAAPFAAHWVDERGHEHGTCICGNDCSTHPDAGNSLDQCADCGADTCPDCREYVNNAPICIECLHTRALNETAEADQAARCAECGGFYGDYGCATVGCPGDDASEPITTRPTADPRPFLRHQALAFAWCRATGRRGDERQILRLMARHSAEALAQMLAALENKGDRHD